MRRLSRHGTGAVIVFLEDHIVNLHVPSSSLAHCCLFLASEDLNCLGCYAAGTWKSASPNPFDLGYDIDRRHEPFLTLQFNHI